MKERILDLEEFVDEIHADYTNNNDTKYVFFLGAGCSKSSGIPLASELAKEWYEKLNLQSVKYKKFNKKHKIDEDTEVNYGKLYFDIFEVLFPTPLMQQKEIQRITNNEKVNPSLGYYTLASLMQEPPFNTVITTNFDNLIQDALIYSGNKRALVITHEDLAQFIERDETPLITKIHGDAHLRPFNNKKETKKIPKELKGAIQNLFTNAKIIFIGYGGNDKSIANLLNGCERIDQIYWFGLNKPKKVSLSKWWKKTKVKTFIKTRDFDRIMNTLQSRFDIKEPNFTEIAEKLQSCYKSSVEEETKEIEVIEDKTYTNYFSLAYNYAEMGEDEKAIASYEKAIEINSKDEKAYYNMGISYSKIGEDEKAIASYEKAVEINPKIGTAYYNMGISYSKIGEDEKAIASYEKAVEIDPKDNSSYCNIGNCYGRLGRYKKALELYKKAIEINPQYHNAYKNMGLNYEKLEEYEKAIETYKKAIEINPKNDRVKESLELLLKKLNSKI